MDNNNDQQPLVGKGGKPEKSLIQRFEEFVWSGRSDLTTDELVNFPRRWLQILDRALRGFFEHRMLSEASSLTYTTLLAFVPLIAVSLAVLAGFGMQEVAIRGLMTIPLIQKLTHVQVTTDYGEGDNVLMLTPVDHAPDAAPAEEPAPSGPAAVADESMPLIVAAAARPEPVAVGPPTFNPPSLHARIDLGGRLIESSLDYIRKLDLRKLGGTSILGLFITILMLLSKIESVLNRVWSIRRSRTVIRMIVDYINIIIILLLLLIGMGLTVTGKFNRFPQFTVLTKLVPYLIIWPTFMFMYVIIPNTRVRVRSALAASIVSGTLYLVVQGGFLMMVGKLLVNYDKIYGAFASLFLMMLWVYITWCVLLFGAEVASVHQNLRDWRRQRREWFNTPAERETLALRMAVLMARPLLDVEDYPRMDEGDIADLLRLPSEPVSEMLTLFQSHGLAVESAEDGSYLLARAPERLSVLDILRLVRTGSLEPGESSGELMEGVSKALSEPLANRSLTQLAQMPVEEIYTLSI